MISPNVTTLRNAPSGIDGLQKNNRLAAAPTRFRDDIGVDEIH